MLIEYPLSHWYDIWQAFLCRQAFVCNGGILCVLSELNSLPTLTGTVEFCDEDLNCFYLKLI